MRQYTNLLQEVMRNGSWQENRTGVRTLALPYGTSMVFDMEQGFPAVTTKKLAFDGVKGEIIGFLRGATSAAEFRALGCKWWDQNANDPGTPAAPNAWLKNPNRKGEDDLGDIYGAMWRRWPTVDGGHLDQVQKALDDIRNNRQSRRIIINAWRPDMFDRMALPPCHVLYQFQVNQKNDELNLFMYQRSCDMFLGVPMNIAGSALMLHLFAKSTGLTPRYLTHFLADAHIYETHLDAVKEQVERKWLPLPSLHFDLACGIEGADADTLASIEPEDIRLVGYRHHPPIKAPMAV